MEPERIRLNLNAPAFVSRPIFRHHIGINDYRLGPLNFPFPEEFRQNSSEQKDLNQKSMNTFGNQNQNKLNNTNSYILEKNNKSNLAASQNQIQNDKIIFIEIIR